MSETGRTVPDMNEPLSRYGVTVTVGCDGGYCPDPAAFAVTADQAHGAGPRASSARTWRTKSSAWSRSTRLTGMQPQPSPGPSCPMRSSARPCHPASQQTTAPTIVPRFAAQRAPELVAGFATATAADLRGRSWQQAHTCGLRAAGSFVAYGPPSVIGNRRSRSPWQSGSTPRLPDPLDCLSRLTKPATACLPTTLIAAEAGSATRGRTL